MTSDAELWQVGLWRRTADGRVQPVTSRAEAELLMWVLTGDRQQVEPVDAQSADVGVWLTTLPPSQADWLNTNGHLRVERDGWWLEAESGT